MTIIRYFWHDFIHRGTTFTYPLIYQLLPNVWKASYTISAPIFVGVPYWPSYSTDKLNSCVLPRLSQWFFHFDEGIVISWIQEKTTTLVAWYRTPSFFMTMQGVIPLLSRISCAAGNGRFLNIHRTHPMSPCVYDLFAQVKEPCEGPGTIQ